MSRTCGDASMNTGPRSRLFIVSIHAARAAAGTGPGSHGFENMGANSIIRSDPHNPHRPRDVETIWQDWQ